MKLVAIRYSGIIHADNKIARMCVSDELGDTKSCRLLTMHFIKMK